MATLSPAMYALRKLHAELGGQLQANHRQAEKISADLRHVEGVIKLLDPTFNVSLIEPRRRNRPSPYFKKGKCFQNVLEVLREAPEPMTATEIIHALLKLWGAEPNRTNVRTLFGGVGSALRTNMGKCIVRHGDKRPYRWSIDPAMAPLPADED